MKKINDLIIKKEYVYKSYSDFLNCFFQLSVYIKQETDGVKDTNTFWCSSSIATMIRRESKELKGIEEKRFLPDNSIVVFDINKVAIEEEWLFSPDGVFSRHAAVIGFFIEKDYDIVFSFGK